MKTRNRLLSLLVLTLLVAPAAWSQTAPLHLTLLDFDYGAHRAGVQTLSRSSLTTLDVTLGPRSQVMLLSTPGDAAAGELKTSLKQGLKTSTESDLEPVPDLSYHYEPDPSFVSAPMFMVAVVQVARSAQLDYENAQKTVSKSAAQARMAFSWYGFRQAGNGDPLVYYYFTPLDSYAGIDRLGAAFVARASNSQSPGFQDMLDARAVLDKVTLSATQLVVRRATATATAPAARR